MADFDAGRSPLSGDRARGLRDAGLSLRNIADELARLGFSARNGSVFAATQVQRMLQAA